MTARDEFDRSLAAWLLAEAGPVEAPRYLPHVLGLIAEAPQRRRPAALLRAIGVAAPERAPRITATWRLVLLAALLAVALLALVVAAGAPPREPDPVVRNGLIAFSSRQDIHVVAPDGGQPRRLSDESGEEVFPAWSPDGDLLAYWSRGSGRGVSLWVVRPDGSDPRRVAHNVAGARFSGASHAPTWSPDGRHLAFTNDPIPQPADVDVPAEADIYIVDADASHMRQIASPELAVHSLDWSPDGEWIAFEASVRGAAAAETGAPVVGIYVIRPDGTGLTQIAPSAAGLPSRLEWSPDGRSITYAVMFDGDLYRDIYAARRTESGWQVERTMGGTVLRAGADDFDPRWSPDGMHLAFVRIESDWTPERARTSPELEQPFLFVAASNGANERLLYPRPVAGAPCWAPDGRSIAVYVAGGGTTVEGIAVIPVTGDGGAAMVVDLNEGGRWLSGTSCAWQSRRAP